MKRLTLKHILLVPACALVFIAWLDPYRDAVSRGNEEYGQKKYNNAKRYYDTAEDYTPGEEDKKKLSFNRSDADYMLEEYDNAISGFQRSIQSDDRDVQKKAFFNTGNAYLKQKNYREAMQAYINALKIDPDYTRAKKNIEYILNNKKNQDKNKDKKDNKDDKKDEKKDKKDNKDNKNDKQKNKSQSGQDDNRNQQQNRSRGGSQMNREQVKNILRSLEKSPVRRQKGGSDEKRKLEKYW